MGDVGIIGTFERGMGRGNSSYTSGFGGSSSMQRGGLRPPFQTTETPKPRMTSLGSTASFTKRGHQMSFPQEEILTEL